MHYLYYDLLHVESRNNTFSMLNGLITRYTRFSDLTKKVRSYMGKRGSAECQAH
jgi:hypothetical protein